MCMDLARYWKTLLYSIATLGLVKPYIFLRYFVRVLFHVFLFFPYLPYFKLHDFKKIKRQETAFLLGRSSFSDVILHYFQPRSCVALIFFKSFVRVLFHVFFFFPPLPYLKLDDFKKRLGDKRQLLYKVGLALLQLLATGESLKL